MAVSPLLELIKTHSLQAGFMSVHDYMQLALLHPEYGYYKNKPPIGDKDKGDFITAPEISQIFGDIIGLLARDSWQRLGRPEKFNIIELGPGRGVLMDDIFNIARQDEAFFNAIYLSFLEVNDILKNEQSKILKKYNKTINYIDNVEYFIDGNAQSSFIIGNEFLDVFPIHQMIFTKRRGDDALHWHDRGIIWDSERDELAFFVQNSPSLRHGFIADILATENIKAEEGDIFEYSPKAVEILGDIATLIKRNKGVGVFIDYGYYGFGFGDTLQALKNHAYINPLHLPGECDLTAHVNFSLMQKLAVDSGLSSPSLMTMGDFIKSLGGGQRLDRRLQQLKTGSKVNFHEKIAIEMESYARLVDKDKMGELFKVLTLTSQGFYDQ